MQVFDFTKIVLLIQESKNKNIVILKYCNCVYNIIFMYRLYNYSKLYDAIAFLL